jgi:hypothetical protein
LPQPEEGGEAVEVDHLMAVLELVLIIRLLDRL